MGGRSLLMPAVPAAGMFMWFVYGFVLDNIATVPFSLNVVLISMKLRYRPC